ncbi:MAG TPA: oxygenase MpaB family protein [Frankiaceae bacterium]|nr:oxygenase MpaB family protein [Frankiaceae bacterium]
MTSSAAQEGADEEGKLLRLTPDPGIFGPDSVSWQVHGDPLLGLGGLRALLLQALHPLAMAGVAAHSEFRADPWGRLVRTARYIGTVTYGTTADAHRAAARVRGLHRTVNGLDPVSHRPYSASDPELLTWVHVTEVDSFLSTARRGGLALTAQQADRYVDEQATVGALLGVPADLAPHSVAEIAEYYARMRPQLEVGALAREAARFVIHPPMPRKVALLTPARPAWYGLGGLAFALLPRWARRMYRLPAVPMTDLGATLAVRALHGGLMLMPKAQRDGPALTAAKERLGLE